MIGSIVHLLSRFVTKSNKIAWQGLHGALVNLVMAYEFDKLLQDDDIWIVDSGASHHVVSNKKLLQKAIPCGPGIRQVGFLGETKSHITHTGDAYLPIKTNRPSTIRLWGAFCDPYSGHNLVSVSRLTTDLPMLSFEFYPTEFLLKNVKTKKVIAKGPQTRNLYLWPHPKVEAWVARTKSDSRGQLIRASTVIKALWKLMMIHLRALMCCSNNLQARVTNSWLVDTGAQLHASFDETIIQNLNSFKAKSLVVRDVCGREVAINRHFVRDICGRVEAVTRFGDVYLQSQRLCSEILIHGVTLVPKATFNILSVSMLTSDHPSYFRFAANGFVMKRLDTNKVIAKGTKRNKLYYWGNRITEFHKEENQPRGLKGTNEKNERNRKLDFLWINQATYNPQSFTQSSLMLGTELEEYLLFMIFSLLLSTLEGLILSSLGLLGDLSGADGVTTPSPVVYDTLLPVNLPPQPPLLRELIHSFPVNAHPYYYHARVLLSLSRFELDVY